VGGAGVIGLGVGSYFGLKAMSNATDARRICPEGLCNEQRGQALADDARSAARVSNVAFALGAAGVAAGAILYLTLPGRQATQVSVRPMLDSSSLGIALHGRLGS
jgi:serine/threonine-protein kinase